jgi:hypothetical protein
LVLDPYFLYNYLFLIIYIKYILIFNYMNINVILYYKLNICLKFINYFDLKMK